MLVAKWLEEQRLWDLEQVGVQKLDFLDSDLTILLLGQCCKIQNVLFRW